MSIKTTSLYYDFPQKSYENYIKDSFSKLQSIKGKIDQSKSNTEKKGLLESGNHYAETILADNVRLMRSGRYFSNKAKQIVESKEKGKGDEVALLLKNAEKICCFSVKILDGVSKWGEFFKSVINQIKSVKNKENGSVMGKTRRLKREPKPILVEKSVNIEYTEDKGSESGPAKGEHFSSHSRWKSMKPSPLNLGSRKSLIARRNLQE